MFDDLMLKPFDIKTYNCWDLTREVWLRLTGQDLGSPELIYFTKQECCDVIEAWQGVRFREVERQNPSIVLMMLPHVMPHVGVYLGRSLVIHIRKAGVQVQPVEVVSLGYRTVKYYVPCK